MILFKNAGVVKTSGGKRVLEFLRNKTLYFFPHFVYGSNTLLNTYASFTSGKIKNFRANSREKLIGADGGEFFVDWFSANSETENSVPIVVIIHGINGGSSEPCISLLGNRLNKLGWKSCCILSRGCAGTRLTTLRTYIGGSTEDLHVFLEHLAEQYPNAPIGLVGYSMGGDMLIKYLGERNSAFRPVLRYKHIQHNLPIPRNVKAAISICPPHDFNRIDESAPKIYQIMGKAMLFYCRKHEYMLSQVPTYQNLKNREKGRAVYPREIFQNVHMPVFHYSSLKEFYDDCSYVNFIDGVGPHKARGGEGSDEEKDENIPLLIFGTKNDPFVDVKVIPYEKIERNPNTALLLFAGGGHYGFFQRLSTRRTEHDLIVQFMQHEFFQRLKKEDDF